ncbi:hypothetical protein SUGI_0270170 [Cryptomeria japonica]|uniref:callose synthase 11 n=1 Tax=Cryptomeria japonica TaxID=3369 RepID=UPI0024089ADD|nr:callose synthase 11 [Cryptomeria japonica]GLJ16179.1 hypothetical protein SUGI_0270170 [Cryptomeria japonica]
MSFTQGDSIQVNFSMVDDVNTDEVYNILPVNNVLADHPALQLPEVRAAITALKCLRELHRPPYARWNENMDILDWLGALFGFQQDNVRNQREHIILLLANRQLQLPSTDDLSSMLNPSIIGTLRKKILKNYYNWCAYLGRKPHAQIKEHMSREPKEQNELLYISLYLLIWGEAANLRFLPECLCYIFHHMALELNKFRNDSSVLPAYIGEDAFLNKVVKPLYLKVKAEAEASRGGKAPHSAWRNYDDMNEYFWSSRCFKDLGWPLNERSKFLASPNAAQQNHDWDFQRFKGIWQKEKVGKTGFVEQRSFWNIFRSFDRLWVMYILFLQAAIIVANEGSGIPWIELKERDTQVQVLSVFITWAGLRLWQSLLDAGMQYSLVSKETPLIGIRMVLKTIVAMVWTIVFSVFYSRMWDQRNHDFRWSDEANRRLLIYLKTALVFIIPELLALLLFILPWVRNYVEISNWRIFNVLTWWFETRLFVARGLREGVVQNFFYTLFWVVLLLAKFSFSYFVQIKPMVKPTKVILNIKNIPYKWHELFRNTNQFCVVVLWAPVILVYFMDTQIWYSIFTSLVGALVGLFSHLGEIRNIKQLRLRFQFFASAIQFNLIPEVLLPQFHGSLIAKVRDLIRRIQLRYGFGIHKKIESTNQVEAGRFAIIWNEIVWTLRGEDILNDSEVELLEVPPSSWDLGVIRWPCLLLCNELLHALSQASAFEGEDRALWLKICTNEYRGCAVIETYDSIKHLLKKIVNKHSDEHSIIVNLFQEIDTSLSQGKFSEKYRMTELPEIRLKLITLVKILLTKPSEKDQQKVVNALQNLYDIVVRDFPKERRSTTQLREDGLFTERTDNKLLFEDTIELPDVEDEHFYQQLRRLQTILTTRDSMPHVPKNLEARRRIAFFSNSLFMNMPRAVPVEKMMAFSVLTPYYDEDVMYSREQLRTENEDGVSIIFYLQRIYPDEWSNFTERMHREGMKDPDDIWTAKVMELRLWASYRGQTLARTVRGMMYYYKALKMLAFLDSASEMDIQKGFQKLVATASRPMDGVNENMNVPSQWHPNSEGSGADASALLKFTYVVTCQIYGAQKARQDNRAKDILYLMKNHEALRIAYFDEVKAGRETTEYYSVLVKYDSALQREVEIYRVMLPGPLKIGEGKPENQNHALIFTRGDALQTIDMNQENYFEEALKMRNLLQEFTNYYGIRKPSILGVRENVFTGSVSSLAWFMSSQETNFVTLGQRVLANPLKIRMHYGHPDVFDRLWFLTRGGMSKASKVINISEDIFAGFNCTLRGGNVTHHEYIQVGKGRDVGLNQISMFEAKVASGNGEQVLSRDVYRLGHRLDFFRMLSFYYSTVGYYFNTMLVVLTVYAFLWGRVYMIFSGLEQALINVANATDNAALGAVINQQFLIQLGIFTALPMIVENTIEHGFLSAVWDAFTMQLQLASVFYTFSMGTRTHYFGRTILHGGAKYRATGRGFVVEHKSFAENYRLYSRSHFIKAIELGVLLIVFASYSALSTKTFTYILLTFSSWVLVVSWIMAPFVFNPSGFDWLKTVYDLEDFMNWLWYKGGILAKAEDSWEVWWNEEQDHLRTTGIWGKALEILLDLRFFVFQYGIVYQLAIANGSKSILVYFLSWIYVVVALAIYLVITYAQNKYGATKHIYYRMIQAAVVGLSTLVIGLLLGCTQLEAIDLATSMLALLPTGWGLICIAQVLRPLLLPSLVWDTIITLARFYDLIFAFIVISPVALLSWLPGFQSMQTRILFNEAFSRGLQISRILVGKKTHSM